MPRLAESLAAMDLDWIPQSLYCAAMTTVADKFSNWRVATRGLPRNIQFDVYHKLYQQGRLCQLGSELCELDIFSRMLVVPDKRLTLHQCFQAIRDHGVKISEILASSYTQRIAVVMEMKTKDCTSAIVLGFQLGGFLSDAGWNKDSAAVFSSCFQLCLSLDKLERAFSCCTKLLHVYNANCMYKNAEDQFVKAQELFQRLHQSKPDLSINLASLFAEYGAYHFAKSEYDKAYRWSTEALKMLQEPGSFSQTMICDITGSHWVIYDIIGTHAMIYSAIDDPETVIDVLRLASRACVVKRQFTAAERLVRHAVLLAKETFGNAHPIYSSTLLDYGFYLLNVDMVCQSQKVHQMALSIRQNAFGGQNLHVAVAHEDLAYASYVHQYSTGRFEESRSHADAAINILSKILPPDHLLLASSNRVKALILEEIAIDSLDPERQRFLLEESHGLHLQSLELARKAFGERNVQTAKHYGNLGRLYQSMELYEKAEQMHLKAITIKEELLGPQDYEVALSVGHIASLYNYDLKQYDKAEELYLRSIAISKRLFGEGYSGLEYDYRGLIKLYSRTGDLEKAIEYDHILSQWNAIRENRYASAHDDLGDILSLNAYNGDAYADSETESTDSVIDDFFCKIQTSTKSACEQRLEEVLKPSRTSADIAFGGPLMTYSRAPRGNDHRNVGDGSFSHSAVSVPENESSAMEVDTGESSQGPAPTHHYSQYDDAMLNALEHFHVFPRPRSKSQKFLKVKAE